MSTFYKICLCLIIIGGINWGLVGLFDFNLVNWICGGFNWASRTVFALVGAAALCAIPTLCASDTAGGEEGTRT